MGSNDVLAEIERRSKDMMRSNDELAMRLRQNQEMISKFSTEFESLRKEVEDDILEPSAKKKLEDLKNELEEKKHLISEMIDDLKPVEVDITRREDAIMSFRQRIDDQSQKIEILSRDLLENKKQAEQLVASNTVLKQSMAEKDGMLKVLKDKLSEKMTTLKTLDEYNHKLEQEMDGYKKNVFALENKVGAIESRVFATNEQNQKLLYEFGKVNDKFKAAEKALAEKSGVLEQQKTEYIQGIDEIRKQNSESKGVLITNYAKKVAILNATIDSLRTKLLQQQKIVDEKSVRERQIISEFSGKMRELLATRSDVDISAIPQISTVLDSPEEPEDSPKFEFEMKDIKDSDTGVTLPSKMDEIIPMIELAVDHGDGPDTIRHSLLSSGYSERDVDKALAKLNLVQ